MLMTTFSPEQIYNVDDNLTSEQIYNADEKALYWPSTLPLSDPVLCIMIIKNTLASRLKIFHSEIRKVFGPKIFGYEIVNLY